MRKSTIYGLAGIVSLLMGIKTAYTGVVDGAWICIAAAIIFRANYLWAYDEEQLTKNDETIDE